MRVILPLLALAILAGCDRDHVAPAASARPEALHGHPASQPTIRTSIGQVRSIEHGRGTVILALSEGRTSERAIRGPVQTLSATPDQLARLRVGDLVEFKSLAAEPHARLLSIETHAHREAQGLRELPDAP